MKDLSAGYQYNNFIGSRKLKNLFKGLPFDVEVKNININGQKRGCSGFITNNLTGKICYITTEPFFDRKSGSGLFGNSNFAIMMRTAESTKDYEGGVNHWLHPSDIIAKANELTM